MQITGIYVVLCVTMKLAHINGLCSQGKQTLYPQTLTVFLMVKAVQRFFSQLYFTEIY